MSAIHILEEKLLGNFYSLFRVGYAYDLCFSNFWLIANNVTCSDEEKLNEQLLATYTPAREAVDKEDVAKSIILASTLQKRVTGVALLPDSSLELLFENGITLLFPTDTEVVDWHWALNESSKDPYHGCIVGAFAPGDVRGNC